MEKLKPSGIPHAPAPAGPEETQHAQFFIPASVSLQERRPRTLKHGDTFAVFDHNGDAIAGPSSPEGLYHRDTRYLSHFSMMIDGIRPMLLSSTLRNDNVTLTCDLTNSDVFDDNGQLILEHDLVHVRRSRFLWNATCYERIAVKNFDENTQRIRLIVGFAADFADLFEVRGTKREKRGHYHQPHIGHSSVTLAYDGLDKRTRQTCLHFNPVPTSTAGNHATFEIHLAPGEAKLCFIEIRCDPTDFTRPEERSFFTALRQARRALRSSSGRAASVATSNEIFNEATRRAAADLYMLITEKPEGSYPYAGIPWFSTVFGRDGIITALETLWLDPAIARGVLCHLANNQATTTNEAADAEPGKILHEVRYGEMAELGEVPFRRYYGSVDSTPLFVILAGRYLKRTGDVQTIQNLWPNIEAALDWIANEGDRDGDGFVEYGRRNKDGLINQGWKDSYDSIFHADGTLARGPIALVEVQAYVYEAWCAAAEIACQLSYHVREVELKASAEKLRKQFDEAFFDEEMGTYVIALDGSKRPCRVRSSNAGHALFTGIAYPGRAASVVRSLMAGPSFSGWGVRTLAAGQRRYNPMSYHNGSVWPHDNALIAAGFARYGFRKEAARIFEGLFVASTYIDHRRLPELFCGFARQRGISPTFYPTACAPQAWSAATPFFLMQSCLGFDFDIAKNEIMFEQPVLPEFLDDVVLKGLSIGSSSVDVALRRAGTEVAVNVLARKGDIHVVTKS